jgi:hypothetical protein
MENRLAQPIFKTRHQDLNGMMENGFFHSSELTIKKQPSQSIG